MLPVAQDLLALGGEHVTVLLIVVSYLYRFYAAAWKTGPFSLARHLLKMTPQ